MQASETATIAAITTYDTVSYRRTFLEIKDIHGLGLPLSSPK